MIALLLEDNDSVALALHRVLGQHGWSVMRAVSVRGAIQHLESMRVDVIVTDVSVPGGPVTDVIDELRALHTGPIVAITGHDTEREDIVGAGFDAVLRKPIESADLVLTLRELVAQ